MAAAKTWTLGQERKSCLSGVTTPALMEWNCEDLLVRSGCVYTTEGLEYKRGVFELYPADIFIRGVMIKDSL